MKVIYVCSRFKGERKKNILRAKRFSRWIAEQGMIPLCVHIYLEKATGLDEKNGDREKLLEMGRLLVLKCDELWIYAPDGKISEGMIYEIKTAELNKIPIRRFKRCG